MTISRRAVLGGLMAAGCAPAVSERPAAPGFPQGVAAVDPHASGALLWTRFDGEGSVHVEISRLDGGPSVLTAPTTPTDTGVVRFEVTGLSPSTWWSYVFVATRDGVEQRSDPGRFRTTSPDDVAEPLHLGFSSCADDAWPLTPYLRAAEEFTLDAHLLLGDTLYADGARTLDDFREKWRTALRRWPNRAIRASTAVINTWDDHEFVNDAAGDLTPAALLAAGREATAEYQPWRGSSSAPDRLWRSLRLGKTAELFVLDCRTERNTARGEYLSRAQLDWLKDGLERSDAVFKLILNSVPISRFPAALFQLTRDDRWEGFPAQREEILSFIDDRQLERVLWLTGDFHVAMAGRVSPDGPGASQLEFASGPVGTLKNPSPSYPGPPQWDFANSTYNVSTLLLDPVARTARLRVFDGGTQTLFDKTY